VAHDEAPRIENDVWVIGCLFVEMFSDYNAWMNLREEEMMRDLNRYFVFKINKDIPKHCWSVICECINPFAETRSTAREVLEHLCRLIYKLKIPGFQGKIEKYLKGDIDKSALNLTTALDSDTDPKAIRKCPMHPKYEGKYNIFNSLAYLFCAQCNEIICDTCKTTIHVEHSNKGVFYEYLEFINLANARIHSYKDKFNTYCNNIRLEPDFEYNQTIEDGMQSIDKLYNEQKGKIELQFDYLMKLIIELRDLEILYLTRFKDHCQGMYSNLKNNFDQMKNDMNFGNNFYYDIIIF